MVHRVCLLAAEKYITVAPYTAEEEDEISFPGNAVAEVIQKSLTGWWFIKCDGKAGLAPATFLKKVVEEESVRLTSQSPYWYYIP